VLLKILANKKLPISRRVVRFIRYLHKKILGWLSFKTRYRFARKNGFKNESIPSSQQLAEYKSFWRAFGLVVETDTIKKCSSISGSFSAKIVPEDIFSADIEPSLNPVQDSTFLQNKNVYHRWFGSGGFPAAYFHKINGRYYDKNFNSLANIEKHLSSGAVPENGVLKVSYASSGGSGVQFVSSLKQLEAAVQQDSNLVYEEHIGQHLALNQIYSHGLNTVRVCVYRSVSDGSLHVLNMSLRMGKDGSLDNETAGGIVCSLNEGGALNDFAVDKHGNKYFSHPNTGFSFQGFDLPDYGKCKECALEVFSELPHSYLASLDLCYDDEGKWRVIEVNLHDQTIRFSQYAGKPFFGPFTDEVCSWVLENHWALRR
jgi:hypothetical protein